jgi:hypothetical protein
MGSLAETANVDYRLSFADQGKQTSVCREQSAVSFFRLSFAHLLIKKTTEVICLQTDQTD